MALATDKTGAAQGNAPASGENLVGTLHDLCKKRVSGGSEKFRNFVYYLEGLVSGREKPESVRGRVSHFKDSKGVERTAFVYPCQVASQNACKDFDELSAEEIPISVIEEMQERFGLVNFMVTPDTGCYGRPLVESRGKAGATLIAGTLTAVIT